VTIAKLEQNQSRVDLSVRCDCGAALYASRVPRTEVRRLMRGYRASHLRSCLRPPLVQVAVPSS
jgi:hypothetical protein